MTNIRDKPCAEKQAVLTTFHHASLWPLIDHDVAFQDGYWEFTDDRVSLPLLGISWEACRNILMEAGLASLGKCKLMIDQLIHVSN